MAMGISFFFIFSAMSKPAVSILVPVYKVEKYLARCLDSVLAQDFADWEMVLVDDGSPDRCPQICDEYAARDARIRVVHKENGGLVSARLAGFREARAEYLMFVDSDDWLMPSAVGLLYRKIQEGFDMVRGKAVRSRESGEYPLESYAFEQGVIEGDGRFAEMMYKGDVAPYLWGAIYKSSLFTSSIYDGMIRQNITVGEDWVTNMLIANQVKRCLYVDDIVYAYYMNSSSYMSSNVYTESYLDKIASVFAQGGVYANERVRNYTPIKLSIDYLRMFFVPELPFSKKRYAYVRAQLKNSLLAAEIRQQAGGRHLLFVRMEHVYRFYTWLYRTSVFVVRLKGRSRRVLK